MDELPTALLGIMLVLVGLLMFVMMVNCSGSAYSAGRRRTMEMTTARELINELEKFTV
jgi:hypothetical protein